MSKQKSILKGLKTVFKYLFVFKKDIIFLSILGIVSAIAGGVAPYVTGRLIDSILVPARVFVDTKIEMPLFFFLIILLGIVKLIYDVVEWRINLKASWLSEMVFGDFIVAGFSRLLDLPVSFHKDNKMGDIHNRISRAASSLENITGRVIVRLAPEFLTIFVALVVVISINYRLSFVLIFAVFVYVLILIKILPSLVDIDRKVHKVYNKAFGDSWDSIFNVKEVKQAISEEQEKKKIFKSFKTDGPKLFLKMMATRQGVSFYQRLIIITTGIVVFIVSFFAINGGQMTIGELIMFNAYLVMFFGPFTKLSEDWLMIQSGLISIERAEKVLATPVEKYQPDKFVALDDMFGSVEFKNVIFGYNKKESVLDDINFKVNPGESIALVGESGAGKSTLVNLISGYDFTKKGKVLVDGIDTKKLNLKFLRSKIAVVSQEVVLFNDTIKNNIKYGSFKATDEEIEEAARKAKCSEFIEKFPKKWKQIVGDRGIKLSVGQKQRVSIARAILRNPQILILDEPTSALDARSEKFIQESLEELMKGRTTFIIAHRLSTVRKADKILVIKDGKIVESGNHESLVKKDKGVYRGLYELQIGLHK